MNKEYVFENWKYFVFNFKFAKIKVFEIISDEYY